MTLFRETLNDISRKISKNKLKEAKKILDEHIEAEHHFQSDLSGLQGAINAYQHELRQLQLALDARADKELTGPSLAISKKALQERILNAMIQLTIIRTLSAKLRRDSRMELS